MRIGRIGEFGLIKRIGELVKTDSSVVKGIGDDCAVIKFTDRKYLLFTCDMITQGVDFTSKESSYLIGRKALGVSISDIAACAGVPRYALVAIGLPRDSTVKFADGIIKGITDLAKKFRINIVGGDLSRSRQLTIDVSILGEVEKKFLVLRSGAKIKDVIFVTGSLGGSIGGKHLRFTPRLKEARFLVKNFKVNSMMDISDGLTQDLNQILSASKVGAVIYERLIPLSPQAKSLKSALSSGEDFELLFTVSQEEAKKILRKKLNVFKPIGEVVDRRYGFRLIGRNNRERVVNPKGFRHF